MPVDAQTRAYIQHKLEAQETPTQIIEGMVAGGWDQQQATMAVQEVSGVQLAAAPGAGGNTKAPLILRIMYIFAFLALIIGIILVAFGVAALGAFGGGDDLTSGLATAAAIASIVMGVIFIAAFFLIKEMKNGSWRALQIYTGLIILNIGVNAWRLVEDSNVFAPVEWPEALGQSVGSHLLAILIIVYLVTKKRSYFR